MSRISEWWLLGWLLGVLGSLSAGLSLFMLLLKIAETLWQGGDAFDMASKALVLLAASGMLQLAYIVPWFRWASHKRNTGMKIGIAMGTGILLLPSLWTGVMLVLSVFRSLMS